MCCYEDGSMILVIVQAPTILLGTYPSRLAPQVPKQLALEGSSIPKIETLLSRYAEAPSSALPSRWARDASDDARSAYGAGDLGVFLHRCLTWFRIMLGSVFLRAAVVFVGG